MIPIRFKPFRSALLIREAIGWTLLRQWALSEVYRTTLPSGETRIIKWGGKEMAAEHAVYRDLVVPLRLKSPRIFGSFETEDSVTIVMEDVGKGNLELDPASAAFLEAARELARIRRVATANLDMAIPTKIRVSHSLYAADFLHHLERLAASPQLAGSATIVKMQGLLPAQLERLYRTVPMTIAHHDYRAKNLIVREDGSILPVDWALACLSPDLSDLYGLAQDAREHAGVDREQILSAYREIEDDMTAGELDWQVAIGGLCWLVKTLSWMVDGGTEAIPGSDAWIPGMLEEAAKLLNELSASSWIDRLDHRIIEPFRK
ncbi:phosphotransferase [Paenibacillus sp. D51F]